MKNQKLARKGLTSNGRWLTLTLGTLALCAALTAALGANGAGPAPSVPATRSHKTTLTALIVGDSISQMQQEAAYDGQLAIDLTSGGYTVVGSGYWSDCYTGYSNFNLYTLLGSQKPPTAASVILTQSGTNDILYTQKRNNADDRRKLLLRLRTLYPSANILVAPVPPVSPTFLSAATINSSIAAMNADTKYFLSANPTVGTWIGDFGPSDWADPSWYQLDGIHPIDKVAGKGVIYLTSRWMAAL